MDSAGQEDFATIRKMSYENTNCFILCFSCADMVTFENVRSQWLQEIRTERPQAKILLVGTKSDLRKSGRQSTIKHRSQSGSVRQQEVKYNL